MQNNMALSGIAKGAFPAVKGVTETRPLMMGQIKSVTAGIGADGSKKNITTANEAKERDTSTDADDLVLDDDLQELSALEQMRSLTGQGQL